MRVVTFANPIAGRGRAIQAAAEVFEHLTEAGHTVVEAHSQRGPHQPALASALQDAEALVVIGGDGSVRLAAAYAVRSNTPIIQYPLGTENLFAREFGMQRSPTALTRAVELGGRRAVDIGVVNGRVFVLMVSIGFDAAVVHDLASRRSGAISHLSYLPSIARQLVRWRPPRITLSVDGTEVVTDEHAQVVVANSRQYAFRFDPCADARMDDGLLDIVVIPLRHRFGIVRAAWRCRTRSLRRDSSVRFFRGVHVRLGSDPPVVVQVDGDPAFCDTEQIESRIPLRTPLDIGLKAGALMVIEPVM